MTQISRRDLIGSAAAVGGFVAAAEAASALGETQQPPFGPTAAPLAGAELPSFRFALGAQASKTFDGGSAKEATVAEFPVSQKLAGVLMQLAPGGLRELHWHANAAEWAYVLNGRCRVTAIDPQGHSEIADFNPGDVWYFPRGHGHSIQGLGPENCLFVLVFDNGYFSEFGTFSITDWVSRTPRDVLQKNFGVPAQTFANFPQRGLHRQGSRAAAAADRSGRRVAEFGRAHASVSAAGGKARCFHRRHLAPRIRTRISYFVDHDGCSHADQAGQPARAALASERGRVAVLHQGPRPHDRVRVAWSRAHR